MKTFLKNACVLAALLAAGMVEAREAETLRANLAKQASTLALGPNALPGCVLAAGGEAVPLAYGRVERTKAPVVAATVLDRGRAVAISHQAFFSPETANRRENAVFLRECLAWLAGGEKPSVVYLDPRSASLAPAVTRALKDVKDFRLQPLVSYSDLASLPAGAVVMTSPDSHPLSEADKLADFLRKGGAALCPVVGWGWHQVSGGKSFRTESPFNKVFGPAGLYTGAPMVAASRDGLYEVAEPSDLPGLSADDALELVADSPSLPNALAARCLFTLGTLASVLPPDDTQYLPRLEKLASEAGKEVIPSPQQTLGPTRVRERLAYQLFQEAWLSNPERNWPAHPAAQTYPGLPAEGTPRETREVSVDLSIPRWHGTGLFAVAGEPVTITLPEGAEKLGLRVRVGSTTCRVTAHERWSRAPVVDVEIPLTKTKTEFASPFGGLIYLVVPKTATGTIAVQVGPACPAARYIEGRDTSESWVAALKKSPAPFVELENDHVVLSVPRRSVQNLRDPAPLLQVWREIMDNDARLTAIPAQRTSPERLVADVQLCAGYMHAGYPVMLPMSCLRNLLSEPTIRQGVQDDVWGFFHEMGHNHQNQDWTFNGTGEVTVNFFSLYNMEKICGKKIYETEKMKSEFLKRNVAAWNAAGRPLDPWMNDPFLALDFFAKLIEKYGWETFEKLFAEYRALPENERPKTDLEKREQWCRRLSRLVGEDLSEEFRFLGVKPLPPPVPADSVK